MPDRRQLLQAVAAAHSSGSGAAIAQAVAALDAFDRQHAAGLALTRETDLGAHFAARALTPVPVHEHHTAATDWLGELPDPDARGCRTTMTAEATLWMRSLPREVLADSEEFTAQALGRASTLASAYGSQAPQAKQAFLENVVYLSSIMQHGHQLGREAASGLPQIDQLIDANNQPSPTPYPTEVFDNFAPPQNDYNGGVESDSHQSQISSDGAPMLQQVNQQNSSGSGFGSGPERPDQHDTSFDQSLSYAEVPLGAPGTIPTAPAATDSAQGRSAQPAPGFGQNQDAGAGRRPTTQRQGAGGLAAGGVTESEREHAAHHLPGTDKFPISSAADVRNAKHDVGRTSEPEGEVRSYINDMAREYHVPPLGKAAGLQSENFRVATAQLDDEPIPGYTRHDHDGFAWHLGTAQRPDPDHHILPHHLVCNGWHYPTEGCGRGMAHTASAAVDHSMNMEQFAVRSRWEAEGTRYAQGVIRHAGGDLRRIASHHDQQVEAFRVKADGNPEEIAWLNGYLATIRPVLAEPPDFRRAAGPDHGQPRTAASTLTQIQQTVDANTNAPTPQADQLPAEVAFPLNEAWQQQWETGPQGAQPRAQKEAAGIPRLPTRTAETMGGMAAIQNKQPHHRDDWPYTSKAHGKYLRAWNTNTAYINVAGGKPPVSRGNYTQMTGRSDLYQHYLDLHDEARRMSALQSAASLDSEVGTDPTSERCTNCGHQRGCECPHHCTFPGDKEASRRRASGSFQDDMRPAGTLPTGEKVGDQDHDFWDGPHGSEENRHLWTGLQHPPGAVPPPTHGIVGESALRRQGDYMTRPHQTTDDTNAPYNSPQTTPQPFSQNEQNAGGQGFQDGVADAQAGESPTFMDVSSHVSPYVSEYARGYASVGTSPGAQQGNPDVPHSMGGDSGQAQNAQEAQRAFMVSKGFRVSAAFVPPSAAGNPDFQKGYRFARNWRPNQKLVSLGSGSFEAGLYAGITDNAAYQAAWVAKHRQHIGRHPRLARRLQLHQDFTRQYAAGHEDALVRGFYMQAATTTDLITDGPGTSPDPMGATPLNGPGQPPPMGGRSDPAQPGGSPPYQGAQPLPQGPVVPDDVMGQPQEPPQPDGPVGQGYSGPGPGYTNQNLAPRAPDTAASNGYSNLAAYQGDPQGGDRVATLVRQNGQAMEFRARAQARLALLHREANSLHGQLRNHLYQVHNDWAEGRREHPSIDTKEMSGRLYGSMNPMPGPRDIENGLNQLVAAGHAEHAPVYGEWQIKTAR